MSRENVETTRAGVAAMTEGDVERVLDLADPGIEYVSYLSGLAEGGTAYHGHDGLRRFFADLAETWAAFEVEIDEYRSEGNKVMAVGGLKAKGRASGVIVESRLAWVVTFRPGTGPHRATSIRFFVDPEKALEALALPD
jgi:ketosteroid isomerase-like protein